MIHKKTVQKYPIYVLLTVHIKFLYNSKLDLTAKSLVSNTVVITRAHCIMYLLTLVLLACELLVGWLVLGLTAL